MPKFYATFGCGHPLDGYALSLIAKNEQQARAYMEEYFGNHYCTIYDERMWQSNWIACLRRMVAQPWYKPEEILQTIDITEFTKD